MTRVPFTALLPFLKAQVKAPILSLPMETAQFKGSLFGEATPEHLSQGANVVFMLIQDAFNICTVVKEFWLQVDLGLYPKPITHEPCTPGRLASPVYVYKFPYL